MLSSLSVLSERSSEPVPDEIIELLSDYDYEELCQIREYLDERIAELEKQYAIEHGNRKITFEKSEIYIFPQRSERVTPVVTRVLQDAPQTTYFNWKSSDTAIAKVAADGSITGIAKGDAVITCIAKDDENIFGSLTVHVVTPVKELKLNNTEVSLYLGLSASKASVQLTVTVTPKDAYYKKVTWSSSNEKVATVDKNGVVKAKGPGSAVITATSKEPASNGMTPKKVTCKVTVTQAVTNIELDKTKLTLNKYGSATLKATVTPTDATNKQLKWSSSDSDVATVSAYGMISAKSGGSCTITCEAADGSGTKATCKVSVITMINGLRFDGSNQQTITVGSNYKVKSVITPNDATNKKLKWSSSNSSVATVSNGTITAVGPGTCTIKAVTQDGSDKSATLSVFVPSISISNTSYTVYSKSGMDIPYTLFGSGRLSLTYSSTYYLNATVRGSNIHIEPLNAGSTTITLTDTAISDYRNTVKITVTIDHSAVYDNVSYPKASYENIMRYPSLYKGDTMYIYGRVLQVMPSGNTVALRVGTTGYGYSSVFYVTYSTRDISISLIDDDYIYVYGKCNGVYTYTSVLGASITVPWIEAEKIVMSRNY